MENSGLRKKESLGRKDIVYHSEDHLFIGAVDQRRCQYSRALLIYLVQNQLFRKQRLENSKNYPLPNELL